MQVWKLRDQILAVSFIAGDRKHITYESEDLFSAFNIFRQEILVFVRLYAASIL